MPSSAADFCDPSHRRLWALVIMGLLPLPPLLCLVRADKGLLGRAARAAVPSEVRRAGNDVLELREVDGPILVDVGLLQDLKEKEMSATSTGRAARPCPPPSRGLHAHVLDELVHLRGAQPGPVCIPCQAIHQVLQVLPVQRPVIIKIFVGGGEGRKGRTSYDPISLAMAL